jgi:fatty acid desaturase
MSSPPQLPADADADQAAYERARRKVKQIKGLYAHASVYCIVIGGLFLINFVGGRPWWFFWPALGWGIGLTFHAFSVYGTDALFGADWEARKIRELMERERPRAP